MRILEAIFLIMILALLIWSLKRDAAKSFAFSILPGCVFLALMLHLVIEGWRWQMAPAYCVGAVILTVAAVRKLLKPDAESRPRSKLRTGLKALLSGTGILLLLISGILCWAFPVFQLPVPTGPYQVGTSQWFLVDKSREETQTVNSGDYREISVLGWYPANASGMTRTAGYMSNSKLIGKAIIASPSASGKLGLTWLREAGAGFLFDYLRLVRTHAYPNAAVSQKQVPYPVLIFSHGYGSHAAQNTALMEELASNGYAVFSIGHTYESLVEIFPDGRQIRYSPKDNINASISKLRQELEEINEGDLAATIDVFKKFNTAEAFGSILVWSADTRFVIDWLEKLNAEDPGSPFYRRLDMNKLGVFGMSYGGSTAGQIMFEDRRVKAAINMDGGLPLGDLIDRPMEVPFMFMNSEPSMALGGANQTLIEYMMGRSNASIYSITVRGSRHNNFMDLSVFSPVLKYTGDMVGKIDGDKMLKIMNVYIVAFFDKHLRGIDSPLLNDPSSDFPEVILKARNR
jgi:predicted dienelactone hydrolase